MITIREFLGGDAAVKLAAYGIEATGTSEGAEKGWEGRRVVSYNLTSKSHSLKAKDSLRGMGFKSSSIKDMGEGAYAGQEHHFDNEQTGDHAAVVSDPREGRFVNLYSDSKSVHQTFARKSGAKAIK